MYVTRWVKAGDYMFIKHYTPGRYGAPGMKRKKREKPTSEKREKINNQRKAEKLQQLILCNFNKGYHITLDYMKDERPETYEEAEKNLSRFLDRMRRKYKKEGKKFKFIAITERGKRAEALHHHMIVESIPGIIDDIAKEWGVKFHLSKMYEDGGYKELAEYFVKVETKEEATKGKSKYHRSRNLKSPLVRRQLRSGIFKDDEPEIPEGYELVEDSLVNGFNEYFGTKHQKYTVIKSNNMDTKTKGVQKEDIECSIWESLKKERKKGCMKIDIFIQTDTKRIGYQKRVNAMYLISCALSSGTVEERNGIVSLANATTSQAALKALRDALKHFHKAAALKLYISDNFARNTMINGNLSRWQANGWKKQSGEIKNLELWKEIAQLTNEHTLEYAYGPELEHITLKKMEEKLNEFRKNQAKADSGEWDV